MALLMMFLDSTTAPSLKVTVPLHLVTVHSIQIQTARPKVAPQTTRFAKQPPTINREVAVEAEGDTHHLRSNYANASVN